MQGRIRSTFSLGAIALLMAACAASPDPATAPAPADSAADAGESVACPLGVVAMTRCVGGRDREGAYYLLAVPPGWRAGDGSLVVHAHGGPELGTPKASRPGEDLRRW